LVKETVSAVIPTWNRAHLVRAILGNLRGQSRPPDQIIVVDNGSADNTASVAQEFGATLISLSSNRGFAAAVNEGIKQSNSDWVLIVNNDVELQPLWIEQLVATAAREGADFAAGKLLQSSRPDRIDGTWDLVSRGAHAWRCGYGHPDGGIWSVKRKVKAVPMTAALFHRRVFDRVGVLDTRFEAYYEDVDFGIRCAQAGLEGIYEPAAVATHIGKGTLGKQSARVLFLTARNQIFLLAKHYRPETLMRFAWPIIVGQSLSLAGAAKEGHLLAALRGLWEAMRQWSAFRSDLPADSKQTEQALSASESQILTLQRQIGFDPYWRLYFNLVRSE
jgi:GT2 family glycosyltransferase